MGQVHQACCHKPWDCGSQGQLLQIHGRRSGGSLGQRGLRKAKLALCARARRGSPSERPCPGKAKPRFTEQVLSSFCFGFKQRHPHRPLPALPCDFLQWKRSLGVDSYSVLGSSSLLPHSQKEQQSLPLRTQAHTLSSFLPSTGVKSASGPGPRPPRSLLFVEQGFGVNGWVCSLR